MVLFEKISSYARSNRDYGSKDILKYFGLYLDSPFDVQVSFWPFEPSIQEDSDHLLPNIEKSEVNVYRLYVGIVWNMMSLCERLTCGEESTSIGSPSDL